jgi:hypothetical protein
MVDKNFSDEQPSGMPKNESAAAKAEGKKANQKKASIAPTPHGKGGFERSQWKGKAVVGRPMKRSGR